MSKPRQRTFPRTTTLRCEGPQAGGGRRVGGESPESSVDDREHGKPPRSSTQRSAPERCPADRPFAREATREVREHKSVLVQYPLHVRGSKCHERRQQR